MTQKLWRWSADQIAGSELQDIGRKKQLLIVFDLNQAQPKRIQQANRKRSQRRTNAVIQRNLTIARRRIAGHWAARVQLLTRL